MDAELVTLPYYNASHPEQTYSGPNNSGEAQYTTRKGVCQVAVKVGVATPSGSPQPPAPDAGCIGLYIVTVAHGQTTITADNIRLYPDAPFITETLTQKISHAHADGRYALKATTLAGYGITDAIPAAEKGQAQGAATLDSSGKVPQPQLPAPELVDGSVGESKLADGAATTPKLADGAVTAAKLAVDVVSGKADKGAECQYNSGILEFGRMYLDLTVIDLPNPWMQTGMRVVYNPSGGRYGSDHVGYIWLRAHTLRNQ